MNNATVRLVGCTTVPGAGWIPGYCAGTGWHTSKHTITHTHTHTHKQAQCSVSRWLYSFYRARALSTPPLFLSLLYECKNTFTNTNTLTHTHTRTHTHTCTYTHTYTHTHTQTVKRLQANTATCTHILELTHQTHFMTSLLVYWKHARKHTL